MASAQERAEAEREAIAADGVDVTLADGSVATLRFGFAALIEIEREYGTLALWARQLDAASSGTGPMFGVVAKSIEIASGESDVVDRLDPRNVQTYAGALGQAFAQAWPVPEDDASGEAASPPSSRGGRGTSKPRKRASAASSGS